MMILVGQFDSPFVRRVAATMTHYGLPFDSHQLSVFGDSDEVRRLNPLGRVPALILDEGETLVDSSIIIDYLDELAPPEKLLTPRSGPMRRAVLRTATIAMGMSERAVQLRTEVVRRPAHLQSPEFIASYEDAIRQSIDLLQREAVSPWILGDGPTQADFAVTAALTHLTNRVEAYADLSAWPVLSAIRDKGEALEPFKNNPFPLS